MKRVAASIIGMALASSAFAGAYRPDEGETAPINDFATGKVVIARIVNVTETNATVQSLATGYQKILYGKMRADMLGRCVSVVEKNAKSVDVNPVDCSTSKDLASRMELKRRMDDAAKGK